MGLLENFRICKGGRMGPEVYKQWREQADRLMIQSFKGKLTD